MYEEIKNYPDELQHIVLELLNNEEWLTGGYKFGDETDEISDKEALDNLTEIANKILGHIKKQLENQYPLWRFENGQFIKNV